MSDNNNPSPGATDNNQPSGTTNNNPSPAGTTDNSQPQLTCPGKSFPDPQSGVCVCPDYTVADPTGDCTGHQGGQQQQQPSTDSGTSGGPQTGTGDQNQPPVTTLTPPSSTSSGTQTGTDNNPQSGTTDNNQPSTDSGTSGGPQTGTGDQNQPPVTTLTPHTGATTSVPASPSTGSSDNNNLLPSGNTNNPYVPISNTPPTRIISTTTNADGSITTKRTHNTVTEWPSPFPIKWETHWQNGDTITNYRDGSTTVKNAAGETTIYNGHGTTTFIDKDGHWYMEFPPNQHDHSQSYYYGNGTTITSYPDGHQTRN